MKNTHTPGQWSILDRPENALEDARILTHINNGAHIVCTLGTTCTEGSPAHSANARLIAAAPDLLEALQQCLCIVDAYRRVSGGDGDLSAMTARAAIAKAKGEA